MQQRYCSAQLPQVATDGEIAHRVCQRVATSRGCPLTSVRSHCARRCRRMKKKGIFRIIYDWTLTEIAG
jgi:hypothetical protein